MNFRTLRWSAAMIFAVAAAAASGAAAGTPWTETVLHNFTGGSDGAGPWAGLIEDENGNLFGTTHDGGGACIKDSGCGTVFKLAPDGTETVLYAFQGGDDGLQPYAGVIMDGEGNLYGTTAGGHGTAYKVTQGGIHTVLYVFKGTDDGLYPVGGLVADKSGILYGTTGVGGAFDGGTVYSLTPAGVHTVLYSFQGGSDGRGPQAAMVFDSAGNLYGTTLLGGDLTCGGNGCGTVFKLTPDGVETVLHAFHGGHDGDGPDSSLIFDSTGNLYGTTAAGGGTGCFNSRGCGTAYKLAPDGTETILSYFHSAGGPGNPSSGVIMDRKGNLFGTTGQETGANCGSVYRIAPGKKATALYTFTCGSDGGFPVGGLLRERGDVLLGVTQRDGTGHGIVFSLQRP